MPVKRLPTPSDSAEDVANVDSATSTSVANVSSFRDHQVVANVDSMASRSSRASRLSLPSVEGSADGVANVPKRRPSVHVTNSTNFGYGNNACHSQYFGSHHTGVVFIDEDSPKKDYKLFVEVKGSDLPARLVRLPTEFRRSSKNMDKPMEDEDVRAFEEYLSQQLDLHVQNVTFKTPGRSGQALNVSLEYLA